MNNTEKLRDILNNYEEEYNPQDWKKLEKDLPKSAKFISKEFSRISIITASVTCVIALIIIFIYNNPLETKDISQTISENTRIDNINKSNKLEEVTNIDPIASNPESKKTEKQTTDRKNKNTIKDNCLSLSAEKHDNKTNHEKEDGNIILVETKSALDDKTLEDTYIQTTTPEELEDNDIEKSSFDFVNNPIKNKIIPSHFNVEINNNCIPAIVTFSAINLDQNYSVIWLSEDGKYIIGNNIEYTYTTAGTYYPKAMILDAEQKTIKEIDLKPIIIHSPSKISIYHNEIDKNTYNIYTNNEEALIAHWIIDKDEFFGDNIIYKFNKPGKHNIKLVATNNFGCKTEIQTNIDIESKNLYYLPDAFIPLSNGKNAEFGPIGENLSFTDFKFSILNDKGISIFTSYNPDQKWNGRINNTGAYAKAGIYFWEIKASDEFNNNYKQRGEVTLIIK